MADAIALESPNPSPPLSLDPFDSALFDPSHLSDDISLPAVDFDIDSLDFDFDFSVDDFLQSPDDAFADPTTSSSSTSVADAGAGATGIGNDNGNGSSPPSPDSGYSGITSREIKPESLKRKKEIESDGYSSGLNPNPNLRCSKVRRSGDGASSCVAGNEEEEKRKARLIRNRESAQLSRQRKKHYVEELEEKVKSMHSTINELNSKISFIIAENATLRQQLGGNGANGALPAAYPPMPPVHFPWIPCGGFAMRPNGSQVPLVPIPRLKPQQAATALKTKKLESKKGQGKTKKVASISLLGLFFIMLLSGGVGPGIGNLLYGIMSDLDGVYGRALNESQGRVWGVSRRGNGLDGSDDTGAYSGKMASERLHSSSVGSDGSASMQNSTETLPAFLYVPRNGKHVKINGNLIISSVLASEKAREKVNHIPGKDGEEKGLAIAGNAGSALAISNAGKDVKSKHNFYRDHLKSTPAEGHLQQWFRQGLTGPILNSGMCKEVFQFEVTPSSANPTGIVPASSAANATDKRHTGNMRNRRFLYPDPIPLTGSTLNNTEHFANSSETNFNSNKSVPSMVVSVLADPKEAGDADGEGMISPKSFSRIFVVVLVDSVKYVTYSCGLPRKSAAAHLVN